MSPRALDMPDEPARMAAWLEAQLAGPDLAALVDELSAFREAPPGMPPDVGELLGEWQEPVLAGGLRLAPPDVVRRLLAWPERLLDLQELVFARGGRYWDRLLTPPADAQDAVRRSKERLAAVLPADPGVHASGSPVVPAILPLRRPVPRRRMRWIAAVAAAVAVALIGAAVTRFFLPSPVAHTPGSPQVAWGWNRPGVLAADGSVPEYLNRLADAADEWFAARPDDPAAVAKRITELRAGCSALLLADHRPLSAEDNQWLTEKCRQWAGTINQALAEVESGRAQQGRDDADEAVHRLVAALRQRAAERAA